MRSDTVQPVSINNILSEATTLRKQIGPNFHDQLAEALYTDAARIADMCVVTKSREFTFHDRFQPERSGCNKIELRAHEIVFGKCPGRIGMLERGACSTL